jgi:hypothetical protein
MRITPYKRVAQENGEHCCAADLEGGSVNGISETILIQPVQHHKRQHHVDHDHKARNAVDAEKIGDLDDPQVIVETVPQQCPWKPGEQPGLGHLQEHPGQRSKNEEQIGGRSEKGNRRSKETCIDGKVGTKQQQDHQGKGHGQMAIELHRVGRPVDQSQMLSHAAGVTEPEAAFGIRLTDGCQQRDQGHVGDPSQINFWKG